jgi:hypothetical protein
LETGLRLTRVRRPQEQARRIWKSDGPVFRGSTLAPLGPRPTCGRAVGFSTCHDRPRVCSGQLTHLHLWVDRSSTASNVVLGVCSDRKGHPGALQEQATITNVRAGSWNYVDVRPMPVTAGQRYWIAVLGPKGRGQDQLAGRGCGRPLGDERAAPAHAPPCALVRGSARSGHWTALGLRELKAGEPGGCDCCGASDPRSRSGVAGSRRNDSRACRSLTSSNVAVEHPIGNAASVAPEPDEHLAGREGNRSGTRITSACHNHPDDAASPPRGRSTRRARTSW